MKQPATPSALPENQSSPSPSTPPPLKEKVQTQKRKLPTPEELIAHYESEGLDNKEASMKVIEDLQNILFRVVTSGKGKKDKFMAETSRKMDTANTRLAILELKLDSKPGYGESLAIGVASGAVVRGFGNVFPHVLGAIGQMWNAVKSSTKS